jgi:hypothetical protein
MDYKHTFASPEGRRVLDDLKARGKVEVGLLPTVGTIDTQRLIYDAAREGLVQYILAQVDMDLSIEPQQDAISTDDKESTDV